MKILISGGSGFIGQALARQLSEAGHEITLLDRNPPRHVPDGMRLILMDLLHDDIRADVVADQDAIIHLMGVKLFKPWTVKYRQQIYDSRVKTGQKLVAATLELSGHRRPKIFVSASAVGYYGNSGDTPVDESAEPGSDFLAKVCQDWEAIIEPLAGSNVRTVIIRNGIVIGPGGMLGFLKPWFKKYLGMVVGSGKQRLPWIGLADILNIYQQAVENGDWQGPVNAVAPKTVTMEELTRKYSALVKRPRRLKMPAFIVRSVFGQLSSVMLFSQNVKPAKLLTYKYTYLDPDFDSALAKASTN